MQGKIKVFSDKIGLYIDKYKGFIDKNGHPSGHPRGCRPSKRSPMTMKNTPRGAGVQGEGRRSHSPPPPAATYEVMFVLSFISLDIL